MLGLKFIHLALPEDFSSRLLGHHRFSSDTIKVAQKKKILVLSRT